MDLRNTYQNLFTPDVILKRSKLIAKCEVILFEDLESKKIREHLWRKVYYEVISIAKKYWKSISKDEITQQEICNLSTFIQSGIQHYKILILKFEDKFNLDIRNVIDFNIITKDLESIKSDENKVKELYTVSEMNHAMETVHCFLICLGDLHRYYIEFNFCGANNNSINPQLAAQFYLQAFQLNPKLGVPHNQLGTLYSGKNFEIDSIFHYLFSLICQIPFELSENNVIRVFQSNTNYIENAKDFGQQFSIRNFIAQLILVIDIFFFDKDVTDFNSLCHAVLIDFKQYLNRWKKSNNSLENVDIIYKLTAIFMFCLFKLKVIKSPKVHSLNAFLVAFCSEIVDCFSERIDNFIADHKEENLQFCDLYGKKFIEFEKRIKIARDFYRKQSVGEDKSISSGKEGTQEPINVTILEEKPVVLKEYEFMEDTSPVSEKSAPTAKKSGNDSMSLSAKNDKKKVLRRRRKRLVVESDVESESDFSVDSSDNESLNTDFDSYDESGEDSFSSNSEDEEEEENEKVAALRKEYQVPKQQETASDNDDIVVENETLVYNNDSNQILTNLMNLSKAMALNLFQGSDLEKSDCEENFETNKTSSNEDFIIEEEKIMFHGDKNDINIESIIKMKYKKPYTKVNPNLIIEFEAKHDDMVRGLKVLFDWLRMNPEILVSCHASNPEFIQKMMNLMNFINIDIFTRKIYFDRSMITIPNVRQDLRYLFDYRHRIPVDEDVDLKRFALFDDLQTYLEWDITKKLNITHEENVILRNFKIIDFGFLLCKMKMGFNFCARTRIFIEKHRRRNRKRGGERRNGGGGGRRRRNRDRDRDRERDRDKPRNRRRNYRDRGRKSSNISRDMETVKLEDPPENVEVVKKPTKGYLKNKKESRKNDKENDNYADNKNELMGKLWLRNEVQNLESKSNNINLTPYLILDSKSLTNYLSIVKNLVKSKKFVILIPSAVLSDLDELKKSSEGARNAIKWMEAEFKKGNRFLRSQRNNECTALPLLKVPKKLDRDSACFMEIMKFCNFLVSKNDSDIITFLTGDTWDEKKKKASQGGDTTANGGGINFLGILESIPVKSEQISQFYSKYKKG